MKSVSTEQLAVEGSRAYYKQWREKNKDRLKEYRKNYFAQKAAALAASEQSQNNGEATENEDRKD